MVEPALEHGDGLFEAALFLLETLLRVFVLNPSGEVYLNRVGAPMRVELLFRRRALFWRRLRGDYLHRFVAKRGIDAHGANLDRGLGGRARKAEDAIDIVLVADSD